MPGHLAFPGGGLEDADEPQRDGALARCASRELREETGIEIEPARWRAVGARVTPPMFAARFDARFFLAEVPAETAPPDVVPSPEEIESLAYVRPGDVVTTWEAGGTLVAPPVLALLREIDLARPEDAEALAAVIRSANVREEGQPRIELVPGIWVLPVATLTLPPATHTNAWIPGAGSFLIVDPGSDDDDELSRLLRVVDRRRREGGGVPQAVLLTHHHGDHVRGAARIASALGVPVRAHAETLKRLDLAGVRADALDDGDVLDLEGQTARVLHTPGHAPGHVALHLREREALLAGDLISGLSTILIDPRDGRMGPYLQSLRRVAALGCRTVLPAHGPSLPGDSIPKLVEHRLEREVRIRDLLASGPVDLDKLAVAAYRDVPGMPVALTRLQCLSHLLHLEERGEARRNELGESWEIVDTSGERR
jgi:glyoxylase-like metal-dependent hydrolase (beta-lactamase superfamily II)/8-oxo-dGTP pyrophosphatase MutT (NUDIX family)